ncbi:MAG: response regulator [Rubrivivax sp.]|nr:response regulator [Rubrivivax sp.]
MATRILVIEDNPVNLELMQYLLLAWQYEVLTATNGAQGLALAASQRPDLVVCDIQMEGIDGYEVARRLRADPALCHIPLVAVTAFAMVGDHEKALAAGFDRHLPKPIDPASFIAAIQPLLSGERVPPAPRPQTAAAGGAADPAGRVPETLRAPRKPCTLLTVDDGPLNVEYKADLLHAAGYELLTARSVEEALAALRSHRVDLVLSDVRMPGGGGFELLRQVRADAATRDLPFVFLTASARDEASRREGLALGADAYLVRPVPAAELLGQVRRCLNGEGGGGGGGSGSGGGGAG